MFDSFSDSGCLDDAPPELHVPEFTYATPAIDASCAPLEPQDESDSRPFHFSALFQSSLSVSPGLSILRSTPRAASRSGSLQAEAFIGFSWGPPGNAFPPPDAITSGRAPEALKTPGPLVQSIPCPPRGQSEVLPDHLGVFVTPVRPRTAATHHTLPRTSATGRTPMRRAVSDREAMRQLVDCIGMSARKKVLASGRKPRIIGPINQDRTSAVKKELRFGPPSTVTTTNKASSDFPPALVVSESEATESGSEGPPSPSPSPRPGSAMSMLSRRSTTPTITAASYPTRLLSLPSSLSEVFRSQECRDEGGDDDDVFSVLERRHAVMVSQLYSMQTQIDRLRELIEP